MADTELVEVEHSVEAPFGLACPEHGPIQYHDEGMPLCPECEAESLNSAGRTPEEEAMVGYRYYLGIAANLLDWYAKAPIRLLLEHGYRNPADVLRELEAALPELQADA